MGDVMICLVGEQPIPNLLPIRYDKPPHVVLAYTETTKEVNRRLEAILQRGPEVHPVKVVPFDILSIKKEIEQFVTGRGWKPPQLVFNLTGGTKAMAFAAYSLAEAWRSPILYLRSEEAQSLVYRYRFNESGIAFLESQEVIPTVITIDDYLKAHLGSYYIRGFAPGKGGDLEKALYEVLSTVVDEIVTGVQLRGAGDLDLVFRPANQVGIAEAKVGLITKDAIEQLNLAAARERLGTYTKKILFVSKGEDHTRSNLRDLARVSEIRVIELPSYGDTGPLSGTDRERLIRDVSEYLTR